MSMVLPFSVRSNVSSKQLVAPGRGADCLIYALINALSEHLEPLAYAAEEEETALSVFTAAEIAYLVSQRLGRLATINATGAPHVVPVRFSYNAALDVIDVGGRFFGRSKKFRDAQQDGRVAFVVDDALAPGHPRGIEIRGRAQPLEEGQDIWPDADAEMLRITPAHIASWGIDTSPYAPHSRSV
jgi:pyridoxamine 5'-phosphate oxidase family protein